MKKMMVVLMAMVAVLFSLTLTAVAFPALPDDLNIVQPDPSLPKELAGFLGKWKAQVGSTEMGVIISQIDSSTATLYLWRSDWGSAWEKKECRVEKSSYTKKYVIWFSGRFGQNEFSLRGGYLDLTAPSQSQNTTFTRVQ